MKIFFVSLALLSGMSSQSFAATEASDRCLQSYRQQNRDQAKYGTLLEVVGASVLSGGVAAHTLLNWTRNDLALLTLPMLSSVPLALAGIHGRKVSKVGKLFVGAVQESRDEILGNNTVKLAQGLNAHIFGQAPQGFGQIYLQLGLSPVSETRHNLDAELDNRAFSPQDVQQVLQIIESKEHLCDELGHPRSAADLIHLMVSTASRDLAR